MPIPAKYIYTRGVFVHSSQRCIKNKTTKKTHHTRPTQTYNTHTHLWFSLSFSPLDHSSFTLQVIKPKVVDIQTVPNVLASSHPAAAAAASATLVYHAGASVIQDTEMTAGQRLTTAARSGTQEGRTRPKCSTRRPSWRTETDRWIKTGSTSLFARNQIQFESNSKPPVCATRAFTLSPSLPADLRMSLRDWYCSRRCWPQAMSTCRRQTATHQPLLNGSILNF